MQKSLRSRAEQQFTATQTKAKQALSEKKRARRAIAERIAKQWALRLAKEAADKQVAETAAATNK